MKTLKYTVIASEKQYDEYCDIIHDLLFMEGKKTQEVEDEIDLLTLLIETWDREHSPPLKPMSPIAMLKSLMKDHRMKAQDLAVLLGVSKSYVSEILSYKKGLSKVVIRKLAERFAMRQDAFNQPYRLKKKVAQKPRRKSAKSKRTKATRKAA